MISGHADHKNTLNWTERHGDVASAELGRTGLAVSQAGFGCYRIAAGSAAHAAALAQALSAGINLIDTSANYADGGSEELVGQVMAHLIEEGALRREAVVVVSKAGYLQGQNHALSQERKRQGRPFPELVPYAEGLEHCIHPEFLSDQLDRSLARLNLETLDVFLLHNPEYFLGWAHKTGMNAAEAQAEYYRRIENAFRHLETEVASGRIGWYGISSNTFPSEASDPQFTGLERVWEIAESVSADHHFAVAQLPMNLFETGAALNLNQGASETVLGYAHRKKLGVLVNRPLNAFTGSRLVRLAEVSEAPDVPPEEVGLRIRTLGDCERAFAERILPGLSLEPDLDRQVKAQLLAAGTLEQAWRSFSGYDHWRQVRDEYLLPRIHGVLEFLESRASGSRPVAAWKDTYLAALGAVLEAVDGVHAAAAAAQVTGIKAALAAADPQWGGKAPLSRLALRAVRVTLGVSSVLVGMRRAEYVDDVLSELRTPVPRKERKDAWSKLDQLL
jgi:hypothetical protein